MNHNIIGINNSDNCTEEFFVSCQFDIVGQLDHVLAKVDVICVDDLHVMINGHTLRKLHIFSANCYSAILAMVAGMGQCFNQRIIGCYCSIAGYLNGNGTEQIELGSHIAACRTSQIVGSGQSDGTCKVRCSIATVVGLTGFVQLLQTTQGAIHIGCISTENNAQQIHCRIEIVFNGGNCIVDITSQTDVLSHLCQGGGTGSVTQCCSDSINR